jgi:membrane protease YdiL (CAAX protease family)
MDAPRVWPVLVAYVLAFVAIVAFSIVAADLARALYPDVPEHELLAGLPGLLAGGLASSTALAITVLAVSRPFDPARLRLRPGRERGLDLVLALAGTLGLGQALDSAVALAGLADRGALAIIRRALESAAGPELFAAVVILGPMAGTAEEVFFRGYVQTTLVQRWRPAVAIAVTSLAFGLLHLEWLHALLALVLGLWLGFLTERFDSVLPALTAHVVNNALFTLLAATIGGVPGVRVNAALGVAGLLVFAGSLTMLLRRKP